VLRCWGVEVLRCWGVEVLRCWGVEVLMCWGVEVLRCWGVEVLRCWSVDCIGLMMILLMLVCCCVLYFFYFFFSFFSPNKRNPWLYCFSRRVIPAYGLFLRLVCDKYLRRKTSTVWRRFFVAALFVRVQQKLSFNLYFLVLRCWCLDDIALCWRTHVFDWVITLLMRLCCVYCVDVCCKNVFLEIVLCIFDFRWE